MNDETRLAVDDAETPVNPYSLLAAVNASSRSANVAWLIFLGLMAYLLIAIASVTHRDLLLGSGVALPLLQVKIGLIPFFVAVPVLLVLLHIGLLGKLALLASKTREFDAALRMLESTDQRSHPLRLELDNFFLVQVIAGPERSRVVSAFLNSLSWLTLVFFPLALLLYVQVAFLPFHDGAVTIVHRLAVLVDVVLLLLMGVFLARSETTYFGAFWRTAVHNPGSLAFGVAVLVAALFVSAFATVPGEAATATAASASSSGMMARCSAFFRATSMSPMRTWSAAGTSRRAGVPSICAAAICVSPGSTAAICVAPTWPGPISTGLASPVPICARSGCSATTARICAVRKIARPYPAPARAAPTSPRPSWQAPRCRASTFAVRASRERSSRARTSTTPR